MTKEDLIKQLGDLVAFKTLSGEIEENSKALNYVQKLINEGIEIERIKNGKAEVLIAQVIKGNSPKYCYMVHMDVVAGRDDQFLMRLEGAKAIGRGTCDMKFSIPLGVSLLNEAKEKGIDFCLMITTDEEVGGFEGAKSIADRGFTPKIFIVPDGGENLSFVDKAKGVCQLKLIAKGKPAHASRPWQGKNAIDPLVSLGDELLKIYGENSLKENWRTTMNFGTINGGISTNQVCPEAEMKIDFRYPETDSIEKITSVVEKIISDLGLEVEVSKLSTGLPTFTDVNDPEVKKYLLVMEGVFGKKIIVKQTYGASDARHFALLKSPVLMHKPLGGEIHSANEWEDIASVMTFYEGLRKYLGLA
jgi:succinyl-diaminopimelate desuccinylase